MRRNILKDLLLTSIWTIVVLFQFSATSFAQTTAFNFQGRLNDGANPANGNFELQFALFDSLAGGSQIGSTVTRPSIAVINGIFSSQLDFGAAAFGGAARFVEIGVRPSGTTNPFTILAPRQQVLSAPYAIQAKNAEQLGGVDAAQYVTTATVGNSFIKNDTVQQSANINISGNGFFGGNVGIGTAAPATKFQVQSSGYGITQTSGGVTVGSFISTAVGGSGWFGTRSNHPLNFFTNDGQAQLTLTTSGNFGIGTTTPTSKLDVLNVAAGQTGIYSESASGRAIWGKSVGSRGVYGESSTLEGVYGISASGAGVAGRSTSNSGVYGESSAASLTAGGVYGVGTGSGSIGVIGQSNIGNAVGVYGASTSPTGFGIYARNTASGGRAIYAEGNVAQTLSSNGLVKAMLYVQQDAVILRCYNGISNTSTGNCGFSVTRQGGGYYLVNFGFQVDNRFFSIVARNPADGNTNVGSAFSFFPGFPNEIRVKTFITNVTTTGDDANFMIILY